MPAPHRSSFLQAGHPSCRPTYSVKALKETLKYTTPSKQKQLVLSDRPTLALLASACTHIHWSFCNVTIANYGNPVVQFSKFIYSRGVLTVGATFDFRQSVQWWDLRLKCKIIGTDCHIADCGAGSM